MCVWQELKDYLNRVGEVTFADAHKEHLNEGLDQLCYHHHNRRMDLLTLRAASCDATVVHSSQLCTKYIVVLRTDAEWRKTHVILLYSIRTEQDTQRHVTACSVSAPLEMIMLD